MSLACADSRRNTNSKSSRYTSGPWCANTSSPVQALHDPSDRLIRRHLPSPVTADLCDSAVDLGDARRRPPQRQSLDQFDQLPRNASTTSVDSRRTSQTVSTTGAVCREPPPRRPHRDARPRSGNHQWDTLVQAGTQDCQPFLEFRQSGASLSPTADAGHGGPDGVIARHRHAAVVPNNLVRTCH